MATQKPHVKVNWVDPSKAGRQRPVGTKFQDDETVTQFNNPATPPPLNPELFSHPATSPSNRPEKTLGTQRVDDGPSISSTTTKSSTNWWFCGILVVLAIGIGGFQLFSLLSTTSEVTATLIRVEWERKMEVSEWTLVRSEGWIVPIGAEVIGSELRVHHYDTIVDDVSTICVDREEEEEYYEPCEEIRQEPYEEYSHTETTCYDDGTCKNSDVYVTKYKTQVVQNNCKRTRAVIRKVCAESENKRTEPVYQPYYFYQSWQWVVRQDSPFVTRGVNDDPYYNDALCKDGSRQCRPLNSGDGNFVVHFTSVAGEHIELKTHSLGEYHYYREAIGKQFSVERTWLGTVTRVTKL